MRYTERYNKVAKTETGRYKNEEARRVPDSTPSLSPEPGPRTQGGGGTPGIRDTYHQ